MSLQNSRFHLVGIGGIGMCGLAELLFKLGAQVTGSDLSENANTERLKSLGIQIMKGHRADHVGDVDVVVYTSAAQNSNPELQEARARKIPLIPRAEALAEVMRLKRGLAVAGTHGKTTTTAMTTSVFLAAKSDPTVMIGGRLNLIQSTALLGQGQWMIAEADESDGSFLRLSPEIAVVTNIDSDHLDFYLTFENLKKAFWDFGQRIPFYGTLIVCGDDRHLRKTFEGYSKKILFYGFDKDNDYVVQGQNGAYSLSDAKGLMGHYQLQVAGAHNGLNGAAALLAGLSAGFDFATCARGLSMFQGVDRRFQMKGETGGVLVYDDYGHHPTEVRATLQGFREKYPDRQIKVFFQPHRFSRTQSCWHEFTTCFQGCDEIFVTDIYPAGEAPIEGITSEKLVEEMKHPQAHYLSKNQDPVPFLISRLRPGDVFVTLGAGDGWKVGMEVLNRGL